MELTVGTVLQGGKYIIREMLRQSDLEVVYKATHTYLDQFVLLRSLHLASPKRDDFAQVKQQFLTEVRAQAKQSALSAAPILDCFEEGELPFVVLPFQPEQVPGQQAASPPFPANTNTEAIPLKAAPQADLIHAFDAALYADSDPPASTLPASMTNSPLSSSSSSDQRSRGSNYEPIIFHPASGSEAAVASTVASTANGHSPPARIESSRSPLKHLPKLPIALMAVALVGGCIGVGTGLALRFDAAQPQAGNKPRLSLFNREQSFPSEGNWPIQEWYSPEPAIEQPLYRATPAPEYSPPIIQALPETPAALEPSVEETKPLPEDFALPQDPALPPANPQPKLPAELAPPSEPGDTGSLPAPDRLDPVSPDNLLPPGTNAPPAPLPPPATDHSGVEPLPLKSLPDSSGI